jgi:hypothetical protein
LLWKLKHFTGNPERYYVGQSVDILDSTLFLVIDSGENSNFEVLCSCWMMEGKGTQRWNSLKNNDTANDMPGGTVMAYGILHPCACRGSGLR